MVTLPTKVFDPALLAMVSVPSIAEVPLTLRVAGLMVFVVPELTTSAPFTVIPPLLEPLSVEPDKVSDVIEKPSPAVLAQVPPLIVTPANVFVPEVLAKAIVPFIVVEPETVIFAALKVVVVPVATERVPETLKVPLLPPLKLAPVRVIEVIPKVSVALFVQVPPVTTTFPIVLVPVPLVKVMVPLIVVVPLTIKSKAPTFNAEPLATVTLAQAVAELVVTVKFLSI
jgi:hypothetical protein